jgi:hypothetical protein
VTFSWCSDLKVRTNPQEEPTWRNPLCFILGLAPQLTKALTLKQSPSEEANSFSAFPETSSKFMQPERSPPCSQEPPPLVPSLNQMNPDYTFQTYCFAIHFNIIISPTVWSSNRILPSGFPNKNVYAFPYYVCHMHCPPSSDHPNNIRYGAHITQFAISRLFSVFCTSSLLGPNILVCTPF